MGRAVKEYEKGLVQLADWRDQIAAWCRFAFLTQDSCVSLSTSRPSTGHMMMARINGQSSPLCRRQKDH